MHQISCRPGGTGGRAPRSVSWGAILAAALTAALAGAAAEPAAGAQWVVTLYTGVSHTYQGSLDIVQPSTHTDVSLDPVAWAPHPYGLGAPYYGVRFSYFPSRTAHVGATLDFTHYKMYAETAENVIAHGTWNGAPIDAYAPLGSFVQKLEIAHGVNLTSLNGEYRWNPTFEDGPWQTHVGAGLLVYLPHADGIIDGVGVNESYQYAGYGGQVFGGAEYTLPARMQPQGLPLKRITLLIESKLNAGSLDIDLDPDTRIDTDTTTLHLVAGVSLYF